MAALLFALRKHSSDSISSSYHHINILDVGSCDVNGVMRQPLEISALKGWTYTGIDVTECPNVDIVVDFEHDFPFVDNSFEIIVSSSVFEHDPMFWMTFLRLLRILKPGGLLYINVPNNLVYHAYPIDAWRFNKDSGISLQRWASYSGFNITLLYGDLIQDIMFEENYIDNVMIFQKYSSDIHDSADLLLMFEKFGELVTDCFQNPGVLTEMLRYFDISKLIGQRLQYTDDEGALIRWDVAKDYSLEPVVEAD